MIRRVSWIPVAILAGGVAACSFEATAPRPSSAPLPPVVQQVQITADGLSRTYRLFTPSSLDRSAPAPLVLVLAGVGNTGEQMVGVTMFDRLAEREKFVVAYPEGLNRTWNAGYCCLNGRPTGPDDVAFIGDVIDEVQAAKKIDPDRIYAVGFSGGALMVHKLGCDLAERIAGVGSVAGAMVLNACKPAKPVSVIEIHGTNDELVPYQGGRTAGGATEPSPPTREVMQRWAKLNACAIPPVTTPEGVLTTVTWSGCSNSKSVRLITIDGGGHTWFAPEFGPVDGAVDATQAIWDFFSAQLNL